MPKSLQQLPLALRIVSENLHPIYLHNLISCHCLSPSPPNGSSYNDFLKQVPPRALIAYAIDTCPRNCAWCWSDRCKQDVKFELPYGCHSRHFQTRPNFIFVPSHPLDSNHIISWKCPVFLHLYLLFSFLYLESLIQVGRPRMWCTFFFFFYKIFPKSVRMNCSSLGCCKTWSKKWSSFIIMNCSFNLPDPILYTWLEGRDCVFLMLVSPGPKQGTW